MRRDRDEILYLVFNMVHLSPELVPLVMPLELTVWSLSLPSVAVHLSTAGP